jgi:hypothetical protein
MWKGGVAGTISGCEFRSILWLLLSKRTSSPHLVWPISASLILNLRFFLLLAKFLGTMRLKMANPLNIGGHNDYRRLEMLVASIKPQIGRFSGTLCRHYS